MERQAIPAFPLAWPAGWPREATRSEAKFSGMTRKFSDAPGGGSWNEKRVLTISEGVVRLVGELGRMGVRADDVVISTNVRPRLDGFPSSSAPVVADPGVAIYWIDRVAPGSPRRVMAIDRYLRVADNLAAVAATIEAMRAIERHGGARILERAFTGFAALPAPGQTEARGWVEILGAQTGEGFEAVKARYRRLSSLHHPDRNQADPTAAARMSELNWAWAQAQDALQQGAR